MIYSGGFEVDEYCGLRGKGTRNETIHGEATKQQVTVVKNNNVIAEAPDDFDLSVDICAE